MSRSSHLTFLTSLSRFPCWPFLAKKHLSVSKSHQVRPERQWLIHFAEHTSPLCPMRPGEPCQSKSEEHFIETNRCRKKDWTNSNLCFRKGQLNNFMSQSKKVKFSLTSHNLQTCMYQWSIRREICLEYDSSEFLFWCQKHYEIPGVRK